VDRPRLRTRRIPLSSAAWSPRLPADQQGHLPRPLCHEYTAGAFRAACQRLGIRQSMGRPGSALDNAVIESWHSTLEFELRSVEHFATRAAARARVAAWIDDYNRYRRHSALQMMSPADYEQTLRAGQAA
jgi:transposase InsO family protein